MSHFSITFPRTFRSKIGSSLFSCVAGKKVIVPLSTRRPTMFFADFMTKGRSSHAFVTPLTHRNNDSHAGILLSLLSLSGFRIGYLRLWIQNVFCSEKVRSLIDHVGEKTCLWRLTTDSRRSINGIWTLSCDVITL